MDGPMAEHATVLILYAHPLLGMGLERLLASEADLEVRALDPREGDAAAALAEAPDVVILERGTGVERGAVLEAAPDALLIDVGVDAEGSYATHRESIGTRGESILAAIRNLRVPAGAVVLLSTVAITSLR